jgi:hypothetical protein
MIRLPPDFKEFLKLLNSEKVEYLLVGGYSVNFYGYYRNTGDIDIWIGTSRENSARVSKALIAYGFAPENVPPRLFQRKKKVLRIGMPPFRIDILTDVSGVKFETCYPQRISGKLSGVRVDIIGLKHLKQNKRASGRLKDLLDLENLA